MTHFEKLLFCSRGNLLSKSEFKELLCLATKDSHFIFDGRLYKQIVGVAVGSPLGSILANAFLVCHEK